MSHYDVLGVSRDASAAVLRESYHAQAKRSHPDRAKDPDSEPRFLAVQAAWETLKDAGKRAQYDKALDSAASLVGGAAAAGSPARVVATWAEVGLADMERCDEYGAYVYACRCGDYFELLEADLAPGYNLLYLPCGGCSLKIKLEATCPPGA
jgi:curved DNA-binding protein CbpA